MRFENGGTVTLSDLVSLDSGVFWSGELPFGTYYIQETTAPDGYQMSWYTLTISAEGISESRPPSDDPRA